MAKGRFMAPFIIFFLLSSTLTSPQFLVLDNEVIQYSEHTYTIQISEILVSASSEEFNGTDWNGDGDFGSSSDQFVELWNFGDVSVDLSNWLLDDTIDEGSAPCKIAWNTTLQPNERIVIFRADSRIEFDYYDPDAATIRDANGTLVDILEYPARDSWWDYSYVPTGNGTVAKVKPPTPGWSDAEPQPDAIRNVGCFGLSDHIHKGSYILGGRIVPMTSAGAVLNHGYIHVQDGKIAQIWNNSIPSTLEFTNTPIVETNGTIYPGLIDTHNHLHYNQAPLWEMTPHLPVENRNAWGGYNNRYEWNNHPDYKSQVTKPKTLVHSAPYWNMESQAMKYVEAKAIMGGTTASQGSPTNPDDSYSTILARNIEDYNFGRDQIHTKVTELTSDYVGSHIKNGNASGTLDAWFIHIAEGVDASSRAEFDILVNNNLLVGELVLIHGVALTSVEFQQMADVGATLVWSPLSNLLLYGQTADIATARQAGVRIALAPDWAPSGSKSTLHELKVADLWDDEILGDIISDYELVQMVTVNAARATGWEDDVGTLTPGTAADLVVIDNIHANPYRNLINAIDPDVRLSVVGGIPLFGDEHVMAALKGDDFEPAGAFEKVIDVTFISVPDGAQSWQSIVEDLEMAMRFDPSEMQSAFGDAADFESATSGTEFVGLDPWYTYGDQRYFNVLNASIQGNVQVDLSKLYDRYYDRAEDINFDQSFEVIEEEPCEDGTLPPCQIEEDTTTTTPLENESSSTNKTEVVFPTDDGDIDQTASQTSVKVAFWAVSIGLMVGLYVVSASGKRDDEEIQPNEENELDVQREKFIPAPPPLGPPPST
ncbi:MAG: amidohydrolase family protein [archaeon]|nr:amidohydrolase family protein [archaeon]